MTTNRLLTAIVLASTAWTAQAAPITSSSSGANATDIQPTVDAFRTSLGTLNANIAGSFGSGRREINWDGVKDNLSAPNNLPADFFNVNSPRGAVFSTAGTGFQVSANDTVPPTSTQIEFGNLNPTYPGIFKTFSVQRLFTALGSNILDVNFFVPGSTIPATVTAFGSVFTDVDLANTTSLEFFDPLNIPLGTFFAETANNGLSFLGVRFNSGERASRVRITSGNRVIGSTDGSGADIVVMDDFIYAEPRRTVPEPGTLLLLGVGLAGLGALRRKRA